MATGGERGATWTERRVLTLGPFLSRRYVRTPACSSMASARVTCTKAVWVTAGWSPPSPAWRPSLRSGRRCEILSPLHSRFLVSGLFIFALSLPPGHPRPRGTRMEPEAPRPVRGYFSFPVLAARPVDGRGCGRPPAGQRGRGAALLPLRHAAGVLERPFRESLRQVWALARR